MDGKLTAQAIEKEALIYETSGVKEHITQPKMVFLSFPSELGTIYSKQELLDIRAVCDKYSLYMYIDGARLGYGLGSLKNDVTLADLASIADAFYIGGTKCGAMFGEALVLINKDLRENFRPYIKQNGAMLAKGWLLGMQFYTLFKDGIYFEITKKACDYAMQIKEAFEKKGIAFAVESFTNQQFVHVTDEQLKKLGEKYIYDYQYKTDDNLHCIRFCTSFSTTKDEVDSLIKDIESL